MPIGTGSSLFPQTTSNRTRSQAIEELGEFVGGKNQTSVQLRAARAWDRATREFNSILWKFNILQDDITLSSPSSGSGIDSSQEYALESDFRAPYRAMLIDSNSKTRESLTWVNFGEWRFFDPDTSASVAIPTHYTARNTHETGRIYVSPPLTTSSLTYPTLRVIYYRRIVLTSDEQDRLNVPVEVDEAIFQLAIANLISQERTFAEARDALVRAKSLEAQVRAEYEGYPDVEFY